MNKKVILSICMLLAASVVLLAETDGGKTISIYKTFKFNGITDLCQFYEMVPYMKSGSNIIDVRENSLNGGSNKEISQFSINPAGFSYALSYEEKKPKLLIYNSVEVADIINKIKLEAPLASFCYSPDAKYITLCYVDGKIEVVRTVDYTVDRTHEGSFAASGMVISDNCYYIAMVGGKTAEIRDFEKWTLRKKIEGNGEITSISFSKDAGYMAVTSSDGKLTLYDARTFDVLSEYDGMGQALFCDVSKDGKYIAVAVSDDEILFQNRLDANDKVTLPITEGGVNMLKFVRNSGGRELLAYHTPYSVGYANLDNLTPYFGKLISEEVNSRMDEWLRQMPGESLEEYSLRVNDETRMAQMSLFQQEIATRLAGEMIEDANVTIGGYNLETSVLTLNFDTMPAVFLTIPEDQVADFSNTENLEFRNPQYAITGEDKFELVYVEVVNSVSGQAYVFDNRERKSLEFLSVKEDFVPIELIRVSHMEEQKLEAIKAEIVTEATEKNSISNHTNISVATHVDTDYNAAGEKTLNYRVAVSYDVEAGYSEKEDFGPGKYRPEESGAAKSMLSIIQKAFDTDFAQYVKPGKKIRVNITGSADSTPIRSALAYDESFGRFENQPVWSDGSLTTVSVTKSSGIETNSQLAFIRAAGMKKHIEENIKGLSEMDSDFRYNVEVSDKKGAEYRRISVEFVFVDAF